MENATENDGLGSPTSIADDTKPVTLLQLQHENSMMCHVQPHESLPKCDTLHYLCHRPTKSLITYRRLNSQNRINTLIH